MRVGRAKSVPLRGLLLVAALAAGTSARGHCADDTRGATGAGERDTVYALPEVRVERPRPVFPTEVRTITGRTTIRRVDDEPSPWSSTADLLSTTAGVHTRRFGGLGSYTSVSVRGSNASQVAFYLDGVPLNSPQYGVVNAADLPLVALQRVEVYRSGTPLALADAGGGVVQLVTRAPYGREAWARVGYADFATRQAQAWATGGSDRAGVFAAYGFLGSHGAFDFLDDNATEFNLQDDEIAVRQNNAFEQNSVTAKLDVALGSPGRTETSRLGSAGRITLGFDGLWKDGGMPGLSAFQSETARFATDRLLGSMTWQSPPWMDDALELRTQLYGTHVEDRFQDHDGNLGTGKQDTRDETIAFGARQEAWFAPGRVVPRIGAVAEAKRDEFRPTSLLNGEQRGPLSRRGTLSYGAETRFEPFGPHLTLVADARRDDVHDEFPRGPTYFGALPKPAVDRTHENTRWHAGFLAQLPANLALLGNVQHSARVPTLFELYGNRGTVVGNRDLRQESLDSQDLGINWETRGDRWASRVALSVYRTDARDLILFVQNSQKSSVAQNVSGALLRGLELECDASWRTLSAGVSWTYQETRHRTAAPHWNGRELPGRPPHEVDSHLQWRSGAWRVYHEYQFVARNYLTFSNLEVVDARHLHDLGVGVRFFGGRLEVIGEVRNLFDDRVQDVAAYPLPGRAFGVALECRI